jgi:potassium-transporting ATPase KdpC subunit
LSDAIKHRVAQYRSMNHLPGGTLIPADAVTASASGLDPHISVKNALLQLPRVAKERGLTEKNVEILLQHHTDRPGLWILGESCVNVLELNMALDGKLKE